jgi:uncharacterized protein (TIGR03435 family)
LIVGAWLIGAALLGLRLAGGWWRVRRLHRRSLAFASSRWEAVSDRIRGRLAVRRRVHVVDSDLVETPTALGWIRPVVLLPIATFAQLTPAQVEAILAHELAHIRRHDYAVNLLQTVAETVLFYHPAVWWVSARIRAEREHCCDDVAVEVSGDTLSYVTALEAILRAKPAFIERTEDTGFALAATGGMLLDRVRRLLHVPVDHARPLSGAVWTTVLVCLLIIVAAERQHLKAVSRANSATSQSPADAAVGPAFEVASIKAVKEWPPQGPGFICGFGRGRTFKGFGPAQWLVSCAYGIPAARAQEQLVGAPEWLNVDLFEIDATSPPDNILHSASEGLVMLRTLLADRFKLAVHRETKDRPTYALVNARHDGSLGPQLRPTPHNCAAWIAAGDRTGPKPSTPGYRPCGFGRVDQSTITNTVMTMPQLANLLSPRIGQIVRDTTGLLGYFDLDLHYSPQPIAPGSPVERGDALMTALLDQLGLKLEPRTDAVDLLVIDHIERPKTD